jgi:hypothetical protein
MDDLDDSWKENSMEYAIKNSSWMCEKIKSSDTYAQNLYAALCNNEFQKIDVLPILKDQRWSCSWRYAGGIIADIQEKGDYIDWYCSGIQMLEVDDDSKDTSSVVPEGKITQEIKDDLKFIGWRLFKD